MSLGVIELSENSLLLLVLGWLKWHHFVLGFTQRSNDMSWSQDIIFLFLLLSREWGSAVKLKLFLNLNSKQVNQPNISLRCKKKSDKIINYSCKTNSVILKKVKKRETGRLAVKRGFSREGQIKPAHNAYTRKLWNGRILFFTFTLFRNTSFFNFV